MYAFLKFPRVLLVPKEFMESVAGSVGFGSFIYCSNFHFVADAVMALNRYRVISNATDGPNVEPT